MAPIDDQDEKPLDPAVERVRRKMVRLMAISIGIMMVGLMAVLLTIVYKVTSRQTGPASGGTQTAMPVPGSEGRISLPAGAQILSSDLDGANVLIRLKLAGGQQQLWLYSLGEDRIIAIVAVE